MVHRVYFLGELVDVAAGLDFTDSHNSQERLVACFEGEECQVLFIVILDGLIDDWRGEVERGQFL
jgi:hypothetical protein